MTAADSEDSASGTAVTTVTSAVGAGAAGRYFASQWQPLLVETQMIGRATVAGMLVLAQSPAFAEGHAVAAKAGALGLGVEYTFSLTERLAVRAGLNGSRIGTDAEESGIDYDIDLVWDSLSVAFDFHPTQGALRLTGGLLQNDNRLETVGLLSGNTTIGDATYTPAEIGTLSGTVKFDDTAPFAGLGWDWSRGKRRFGMSLDFGIVSQGAPSVDLQASGTLFDDQSFQADIAAEEAELVNSLDDLDLVPYMSLGFVFRF
jgi:hypothetical protein